MSNQYSKRRDYFRQYYKLHPKPKNVKRRDKLPCKGKDGKCPNTVTTACASGLCFGCRRRILFNLDKPLNKFWSVTFNT